MKVLKFWAEWCVPCRSMEPIVKSIVEEYGVDLKSLNVDEEEGHQEAVNYKIRNIPALVLLDDNNNVINKLVGTATKTQLKDFLSSK